MTNTLLLLKQANTVMQAAVKTIACCNVKEKHAVRLRQLLNGFLNTKYLQFGYQSLLFSPWFPAEGSLSFLVFIFQE